MGAQSMTSILPIKNAKNLTADSGKLVVRCEKLEDSNCKDFSTQSSCR